MMVTIRKAIQRAGLSEREVRIARGILRQARWRIENPDAEIIPRDTPQNEKRELLKKAKEEESD